MDFFLLNFALKDAFFAGCAATAFAFCLGVPRAYILYSGLCAAVGHSVQAVLLMLGVSLVWSTFFGALLIGGLGLFFAKRFLISQVIFAVPGIIPMLPGTFIFNTFLAIFDKAGMKGVTSASLALEVFSDFLRAVVILCALAIGLALPYLMFRYGEKDY
jgi:uncharacterized membrane protein YjjB (DUF3815 family)